MVGSSMTLKFYYTNSLICKFNYDHQLGPEIKAAILRNKVSQPYIIPILIIIYFINVFLQIICKCECTCLVGMLILHVDHLHMSTS